MDALMDKGWPNGFGAPSGRMLLAVVLVVALSTGCTAEVDSEPPGGAEGAAAPPATSSAPPPEPESSPESELPAPSAVATVVPPPAFDSTAAFEVIEHLAGEIGPREATSDAFHEAAEWVGGRFEELGYEVARVEVPVPRGDPSYRPEWGTVVEPGTSANVIADPADFDLATPHVVIGAHLDTVAVSPGAEDNASGIAVMLELARLAVEEPLDVPVRFVAFGAEEPRGSGDSMHHFGSQQYVRELSGGQRDGVAAMVSLDRVGVAASDVPICTGGTGTTAVRNALVDAANLAGIDSVTCENRASDHWSFEKAGIPAARLGSVPYPGYHSPGDQPGVVDADQLDRVGTIVWQWLQGLS